MTRPKTLQRSVSASAGMRSLTAAAIASAVPPGKALLVVANGVYGDRMGRIARAHGILFHAVKSDIFTPAELDALRGRKTVQIIDARISDPGPHGHSYFHSNAAVSSDLIL